MNTALPRRLKSWEGRLEELVAFIERNGRLPRQLSDDPDEQTNASWLRQQKHALQNKILTKERVEALRDADPLIKSFLAYKKPTWDVMIKRLTAFVDTCDRIPREASRSLNERRLSKWLCTQRVRASNNELSKEKVAELGQTHRLVWLYLNPRANEEHRWNQRLLNLKSFLTMNGSLPRERSAELDESSLGRWLRLQRLAQDNGELSPEQRASLLDSSPAVRKYMAGTEKPESASLRRLVKCLNENGRIPRPGIGDDDERRAGRWLSKQWHRHRRGELSPELESQIREGHAMLSSFFDEPRFSHRTVAHTAKEHIRQTGDPR